jgi:hypothetical protein
MESILCQIIVDDVQKFLTVEVVESDGKYFAKNPMDNKGALIPLDPQRFVKNGEVQTYKGVLLRHRSVPID